MDLHEVRRQQHGRGREVSRLLDVASREAQTDAERFTLTRPRRSRCAAALAWVLLALALLGAAPAGQTALAADPTADPAATSRTPTCAERFPAEGPAGVDLRLGCIVGEVVGLYTPDEAGPPLPLSSYAIAVGILLTGVGIVVWLALRLFAQRAGRRLAPTLAAEWWVCATCKSVNGANVAHCYSCGSPPPRGPALVTDDNPNTPQSFGSTRKRG